MPSISLDPCSLVSDRIRPLLSDITFYMRQMDKTIVSITADVATKCAFVSSRLDDIILSFTSGINMFIGDIEKIANDVMDLLSMFIKLTITPPKTYIDLFLINPIQKAVGGSYQKAKIIAFIVVFALMAGALFTLVQFTTKGLLLMM